MDCCVLLPQIMRIAHEAGMAILEVYHRENAPCIRSKADDTPVTEADLAAHRLILASLERLTPEIPVLSEESAEIPYEQRRAWKRYWLVDPLDGTKEFLKRNDEFTVNIALIENGRAVLGVVHVPVSDTTYAGTLRLGAIKRDASGRETSIHIRTAHAFKPLTLVTSRSHSNPRQEELLKELGNRHPLAKTCIGSSLKLCLIAEGMADLNPRLGPTSEWDTAAAHAILEAAGGKVVGLDFAPLRYNKTSLINPDYLALGDPEFDWSSLMGDLLVNGSAANQP